MRRITLAISLLLGSSLLTLVNVNSSPSSILREISFEDHFIEMISSNSANIDKDLPNRDVLAFGIKGYLKLQDEGKLPKGKPLTVIDFTLPSTEKRMWVIDMEEGKFLHHGVVSHGRNSGDLIAERFSNVSSSYMSSLGFYLTGETYQGKHGYSLRLDGLEQGFNDKARERAIVIHGADYAREQFIKQTGRLGRSLGCPALPEELAKEVIDLIKDQSLLFIFGKDSSYLSKSKFLNA
ncbi:hypothetical protein C943_02758 [Mariniradius saccharolyticus AK6]|uniref:YkuD domain-containing protein n=1 Tax=Mariniradius saccharolyticus AK6 TaxID=1239962 RepID=M7X0C9_9BACT|nr:murein L,D-transpeptidase catalytic domain family protein [Mariniradius saccharolyticus]EMS30970.1 hypothetical protein C943_02758 [Mariniradius saccharolyticus AK6]